MDAIILAGGFGKRLGKLTEGLPKGLLEIPGNLTILESLIGMFMASEIQQVYIIAGKFHNQIDKFVKSLNLSNISTIQGKNYEKGPLYTFENAGNLDLRGDFLLSPSDIIFEQKFLPNFLNQYQKNSFCIPFSRADSNLANPMYIQSKKDVALDQIKVLGFNKLIINQPFIKVKPVPLIILNEKIFEYVKRAIELNKMLVTDALNLYIKEKKDVFAFDFSQIEWYDIDTPENYEALKSGKMR